MRVILLERVAKLGQMGDIVEVRQGFARNFLIPNNKATQATPKHIEDFKKRKVQLEANNLETKNEALKLKNILIKIKPSIVSQASESGHLYGSVKARDIARTIEDEGISISQKQIIMKPVKTIGMHSIEVKLHPEVSFDINVCIATSDEEASSMWDSHEKPIDPTVAPQPSYEEAFVAFEKQQNAPESTDKDSSSSEKTPEQSQKDVNDETSTAG